MVAVTFGAARVAAPATAEAETAGTKARSIFARVFDAIAASQMKRAEREIVRYRHLLPPNFDLQFGKLRRDDLPFGGW